MIEAALASAKALTRETYADEEVRFMVRTYLNNGADMEATRAAYFEFYPQQLSQRLVSLDEDQSHPHPRHPVARRHRLAD